MLFLSLLLQKPTKLHTYINYSTINQTQLPSHEPLLLKPVGDEAINMKFTRLIGNRQ